MDRHSQIVGKIVAVEQFVKKGKQLIKGVTMLCLYKLKEHV